jgi:ATP-dependent protease HslVU (ClpYQ) ATPase subunit
VGARIRRKMTVAESHEVLVAEEADKLWTRRP